MPKIRIFLVEDEFIHAENTKLSVEEAGFSIVGECDNADEALKAISNLNPDIVLMDISLPGKNNGITLAQKLKEKNGPHVIFTTSFSDSETIKEASETSPVSYLVKPVRTENLKAAVLLALNQNGRPDEELEIKGGDVFIKSGSRLQKILIQDILWIESAGDNYCKVVTAEHQLVPRYTLKAMVAILDSETFVQTHRAFVVNRHKIESIHEKEQVIKIGQHEIPIGRTYKEDLYASLKRL